MFETDVYNSRTRQCIRIISELLACRHRLISILTSLSHLVGDALYKQGVAELKINCGVADLQLKLVTFAL